MKITRNGEKQKNNAQQNYEKKLSRDLRFNDPKGAQHWATATTFASLTIMLAQRGVLLGNKVAQ